MREKKGGERVANWR